MKIVIGFLLLFAVSANATVDCSKLQNDSITVEIKSIEELQPRLQEYYACISQHDTIAKARQAIIEKTKEILGSDQCQFLGTKKVELSYWMSGRYDVYGETGGNYEYLFLEPYYCSAVGTGLFEGVTDNALVKVYVVHSEKNLSMCAPDVCQDDMGYNTLTFSMQLVDYPQGKR